MSVRFGRFEFHADRRQLLRDGVDMRLTPKAFDLLTLLIQRAPAVVSKADIHAHLWPGTFVSDATLAGLVKEVRRAFGDDGIGAVIRTSYRVGFAFAALTSEAGSVEIAPEVTHWLVVDARRVSLHEGANVLGRDPDAAVWLDVPGVSRRHAQIVIENGAATLEDLGSKNGTLVGDRPVRGRVVLRNADRIQLATQELIFHMSGKEISTATVPVPPGPDSD